MNISRNQFSDRLKAFNVLTRGFVYDERDAETRDYIKRIIVTGHKLVTGKIQDEDVDFDIYDIVTLMVANDRPYMRDYLNNIDPMNITNEDYESLNKVLASLIHDNTTEL